MTPQEPMVGEHEFRDDAAAYALGALEPAEAAAFRRHMAECAICRDEVASFQQVTNAMAMAPQQLAAPRQLRRRVVDTVRAEAAQNAQAPTPSLAERARGWVPRPVIALATVAAIAAALVIGLVIGSSGSPSTRVVNASVTGRPGSAELRVRGNNGDLILRGVPQPSAGHIYQMWELKNGAKAPTNTRALFSVGRSGEVDVGVPGDLKGVKQVLVTQEPAGGSPAPTRAPFIVATVRS
jgi:anti-sigma-K factor RskA